MRALFFLGIVVAGAGCQTWGVEPVEQTVTVRDDEPIGTASMVRVAVATESQLEVVGGADELSATLDVTAWVADASDVNPSRDLQVDFRRERDGAIRIDPHYADGVAEHVTLEAVSVWMPDGLDLDVEGEAGDVIVSDVPGRVRVSTPGDAITVRNVGPVALSSSAGSVVAEIAHGGSIETGGGAAEVTITGNDFDLLSIECGTAGGATVRIPRDLPLTLDVLATGEDASVTVEVAGGRITDAGTQRLLMLNGGGPLVYVRTTDGTITVTDGSWVADR